MKLSVLFALLTFFACGPPIDLVRTSRIYAHNDYDNPRPLTDAREWDAAAIEVDLFLEDGRLLVGHDRSDLAPGRSFVDLYLTPIVDHLSREPEATRLLFVELKERDPGAYAEFRRVIAPYEHLVTVVRNGHEVPGRLTIIMVGWTPSLSELANEDVRYVSVHRYPDQLRGSARRAPAHLVRMVSINYRRSIGWGGDGDRPPTVDRVLRRGRNLADEVPGRWFRVHAAPAREGVYRALVDGEVDLIGSRTLSRSARLLAMIGR